MSLPAPDGYALHQAADQSYLDFGVRLLEVASTAQRVFASKEPDRKWRILKFVISNATWKRGTRAPEWQQSFDLLEETAALAAVETAQAGDESARCRIRWRVLAPGSVLD